MILHYVYIGFNSQIVPASQSVRAEYRNCYDITNDHHIFISREYILLDTIFKQHTTKVVDA